MSSKINTLADQIIEKLMKSGIAGENRKVSISNKILKPENFKDEGITGIALKPPTDTKVSTPTKPHKLKSKEELTKDEMDKSNYGPSKMRQYNATDNIKRKANNTGDVAGHGPNTNVKAYSSKPGQLSAHQAASREINMARKNPAPVKVWTKEQIAAENQKRKEEANKKLIKHWSEHKPFPNADEEVLKIQQENPAVKAEELMANQLAKLMAGKSMLGIAPPPQPTDEEMFGRFVVTQEQVNKAEQEWNDVNKWFREVTKPISSRFKSPEEEAAYWDSIKIEDKGE